MIKKSENRQANRYKGAFPIELKNGKGITRDFNSSGIFFETDKSFIPGQSIEFTIVLEYVDPDRPVHLRCRGKIVRVEDKGNKMGIASTISAYTFEKLNTTNAGQLAEKRWKGVKRRH
jgi:hypothetical protein